MSTSEESLCSEDGVTTSDDDELMLTERYGSSRKREPDESLDDLEGSGDSKKRSFEDRKKWDTLEHCGILFPPDYEPHGVKLKYNGVEVELTPEQEEAATLFAVMLETDYAKKETFCKNFWEDFQVLLGKDHIIQEFEKIDFTPIFEWKQEEKTHLKNLPKDVRKQMKEEKEAAEAKYKTALVDGVEQQVGNFRVEPPGLFRGRGDHPKMGKIKRRIYPKDITINMSPGAPVPEHPYPGQTWKAIKHDDTVTWLAFWKDPISPKDFKYVFLAANSTFKSESDMAKYEKARKLKDHIVVIRQTYRDYWISEDQMKRQMGTALYFIDKLALRAGHEKDADEADTVGCCTLKVENVKCIAPCRIEFDFLGKDSIRYVNCVEVEKEVYLNVSTFLKRTWEGKPKQPGDQLFDTFDAQDLNKELKELMDGLSAKVFRTYNASVTLQQQLREPVDPTLSVDQKKALYDEANKKVALLCNHQKTPAKTHETQIEKLESKLAELDNEINALNQAIEELKLPENEKDVKELAKLEKRRRTRLAQREKKRIQMENKESMKSVALGTSKINYLDPRITVAWCKRNEMPIEKVYNNSLLQKFCWAMTISMNFEF